MKKLLLLCIVCLCVHTKISAQNKTKKKTREEIKLGIKFLLEEKQNYEIKKIPGKNVYIIIFDTGEIKKIELLSPDFYVVYFKCYRISLYKDNAVIESTRKPNSIVNMQEILEELLKALPTQIKPDT